MTEQPRVARIWRELDGDEDVDLDEVLEDERREGGASTTPPQALRT